MGVGAGYRLRVNNVELDWSDFSKVKVEYKGDDALVTVPVKPGRCGFSADHPYWGIGNRDDVGALVEGGEVKLRVDKNDFRYDDYGEFYGEGEFSEEIMLGHLSNEIVAVDIEDVFSRGWSWCKPDGDWNFGDGSGSIDAGENPYTVTGANIKSREMAHKVNFVHDAYDMVDIDEVSRDWLKEGLRDDWSRTNSRGSLDDFVREAGLKSDSCALLFGKGSPVVFNKEKEGGKWPAVIVRSEEPWYERAELDDSQLAKLYLEDLDAYYSYSDDGEQRERFYKNDLTEGFLSLGASHLKLGHDKSFVRNALYTDPVRKAEIEMYKLVADGKCLLFNAPAGSVKKSVERIYRHKVYPPLCITDDGKILDGLAQVQAGIACGRSHPFYEVDRSFVLSSCKDKDRSDYVRVLNVSRDDAGKPCLKSYGFRVLGRDEEKPAAVRKIQAFRDVLRASEKYQDADLKVFLKPGATLKDYIAGYLAAARLGVAFEATPEMRDGCRKEFRKLLKDAIVEGKHKEFFQLFDDELKQKERAFRADVRKDVERVVNASREVPEVKEVSPEEMDNNVGY